MTQEIKASDSAISKIIELLDGEDDPELRLRIYIVGGGCSGFQYGFGFDKNYDPEEDAKFDVRSSEDSNKTTEVVVDYMSLEYLQGATVDYVENLQGAHFVVNNPNAKTTCGCGNSFSVD